MLRHEVALITVKPARAGLDRLFHQPFPTGTCVVVFRTTGCEAAGTMKPHPCGGGQPTARGADDWQPQAGRELGMDRMVKTSELLPTRRHWTSSASGCHAVTKMVRGQERGLTFTRSWMLPPPASRQNLTDPVSNAERGKPDLLLSGL